MKKLIGTTALVMALAAPGFAQTAAAPTDTTAGMTSPYLPGVDAGVRASDFIGKRVYVTESDLSGAGATAIDAADDSWEDAGEISDLIISMNGDSEAVLVDFGGFIGIGEKTVAVDMKDLVLVPDSASADDYFIVFQGSKAALESAPAFDPDMIFAAEPAAPATTDTTTAAAPTAPDTMAPAATDTTTAVAPTGTDAGAPMAAPASEPVDYATMTEEDLIGMRVYGPGEEDVGEVSSVMMAADGKIEAAVVDVGGFLGIGEKPVALMSKDVMLVTDADGDKTFRVSMTQEQLEALPTYEK